MEGEEEGVSLRRSQPIPCSCAPILSQASQFRGISCQEVFRQIFLLVGYEESFSRAVFVRFVKNGKGEKNLPLLVKMYCEATDVTGVTPSEAPSDFCFGCNVNPAVEEAIYDSYRVCFPEVTDEFLEKLVRSNQPLELTDEAVFRVLIASASDEEDWSDLMRQDDFS